MRASQPPPSDEPDQTENPHPSRQRGEPTHYQMDQLVLHSELSRKCLNELQQMEGVSGVHIMAIEWEAAIRQIVERAGLLPRPIV